mgnify:CR=1 FL=1
MIYEYNMFVNVESAKLCFTQYYLLVCILGCAFIFADKALDRDNYMTPEMAKEFGVIDHIVGNTPVAEEENKWRSCR